MSVKRLGTEDVAGLREQLARAATSITQQIGSLRETIAQLDAELTALEQAPVPPDELLERFEGWVDTTAARYRDAAGGPYDFTRYARDDLSPLFSWSKPGLPFPGKALEDPGAVCFWLGDVLKATARREIRRIGGYPEPGPRSTERPALIGQAREQLAARLAEEEEAIQAAARCGVRIPRRPAIVGGLHEAAHQRSEVIRGLLARIERDELALLGYGTGAQIEGAKQRLPSAREHLAQLLAADLAAVLLVAEDLHIDPARRREEYAQRLREVDRAIAQHRRPGQPVRPGYVGVLPA